MSNYDNPELRYSCFSEPSLVSRSHPRSLSLIINGVFMSFLYPSIGNGRVLLVGIAEATGTLKLIPCKFVIIFVP